MPRLSIPLPHGNSFALLRLLDLAIGWHLVHCSLCLKGGVLRALVPFFCSFIAGHCCISGTPFRAKPNQPTAPNIPTIEVPLNPHSLRSCNCHWCRKKRRNKHCHLRCRHTHTSRTACSTRSLVLDKSLQRCPCNKLRNVKKKKLKKNKTGSKDEWAINS